MMGIERLDDGLRARVDAVVAEGWEIFEKFDSEVRGKEWHPFVAADYDAILETLIPLRAPGLRFLEWGSASGVITILADLLGFEAYGIELDADLVETARELARRHGSAARFVEGSFLPTGYRWRSPSGDERIGTIGYGESAYPKMGHPLEDFDVVYAYPWDGEEPMMRDLMLRFGAPSARLILHGVESGMRIVEPRRR
jgi:hypothetical protein